MTKLLFIFFSLLTVLPLLAQKTTVVGFAPEFIGKEVNIFIVEDFITYHRKKVGSSVVLQSDSSFHISFENHEINKAIVEIENIIGYLYVDTVGSYEIIFQPKSKEAKKFTENKITLSILNLPEDDINYKILAFDMWIDDFLFKHYYKANLDVENDSLVDPRDRSSFQSEMDTFKLYIQDYYKEEQNQYFLNYIKFSIAQIDDIRHTRKGNNEGIKSFENYLKFSSIQYNNEKYISYFKHYFSDYFASIPSANQADVVKAIHNASPRNLWNAVSFDYRLKNPLHKELLIIIALGQAYYEMTYEQNEIVAMLDSLKDIAKVPQNKIIARNILNEITNLSPGYPAPILNLITESGENKTWLDYEGTHIYVNFFETWCTACIKEMAIIDSLRATYGIAVKFISVCTDSEKDTYDAFRKNNANFNWDFYHIASDKNEVLRKFKIKDLPAYFLLDQDGFVVQAPAQRPIPDGEYQSIEGAFLAILKAMMYRDE